MRAQVQSNLSPMRAQHFPKYPASEGYPTVGEALEKFFSNGVWKYEMESFPSAIISFSGIAKNNGQNARFTWVFSIITVKDSGLRYGGVLHEHILINNIRASEKEYENILAAILLN